MNLRNYDLQSAQFVGVETVIRVRLVGAVNTVARQQSGSGIWQITVPKQITSFRHRHLFDFVPAFSVVQTQFDLFSML